MSVQVNTGEVFENVRRCMVAYRDGTERVYNSDKTEFVFVNLQEIACMSIQK